MPLSNFKSWWWYITNMSWIWNQLKVIDKIREQVKNGVITEEELNEKVYRIIKLKQKYNIEDSLVEHVDIESINYKTNELLDKSKD